MPVLDKKIWPGRKNMTRMTIVVVLLTGLLLFGALTGDFVETWRNGATL